MYSERFSSWLLALMRPLSAMYIFVHISIVVVHVVITLLFIGSISLLALRFCEVTYFCGFKGNNLFKYKYLLCDSKQISTHDISH